jgi:dynein heavy chain
LREWLQEPFLGLSYNQIDQDIGNLRRVLLRVKSRVGNHPRPIAVCDSLLQKIDVIRADLPVFEVLCNPGMRERHWHRMVTEIGYDPRGDGTATMQSVLEDGRLRDHLALLTEISDSASRELALERTLVRVGKEWVTTSFTVNSYRETGTFVLAGVDPIQEILDDHIVKMQAIRSSPFIGPFESKCRDWEALLLTLQASLDEWLRLQGTWLYLEPIFSSPDILKQMPKEGMQFRVVDAIYRETMTTIVADPLAMSFARIPDLMSTLKQANTQLEEVQKGLSSACFVSFW